MKINLIIALSFLIIFVGCRNNTKSAKTSINQKPVKNIFVPVFNEDTAYQYIATQTAFGSRVPETEAHANCKQYLINKLKQFTPHVQSQDFKSRIFNGSTKRGSNIIASFQPEKKNRVLLAAHWDSRPYADYEDDFEAHDKPIDGANDGASGVGVLLEIARHLSKNATNPGIDIIFFDLEDWGEYGSNDSWALGSQYWGRNPHQPNYRARYGILLDMVGASNPIFKMEMTSVEYAQDVLTKVWNTAARIGYQDYFLTERSASILDDHVWINEYRNIPTIDIIHYDRSSQSGFFPQWHTREDNLEHIDPNTLKIVGQTVLTVIYEER